MLTDVHSSDRRRISDPGRISYVWQPDDVDPVLGLGPSGAWWLTEVAARRDDAREHRERRLAGLQRVRLRHGAPPRDVGSVLLGGVQKLLEARGKHVGKFAA